MTPTPYFDKLVQQATPGPYVVIPDEDFKDCSKENPATLVFSPGTETIVASTLYGASNGQSMAECEANARLLSLAPHLKPLKDALMDMMEIWLLSGSEGVSAEHSKEAVRQARAALSSLERAAKEME